jgi:hypothetical protein
MSNRVDYEQVAAKLDYAALEKKLAQLAECQPPKKRKTVADVLEPVRERLLALHRKGWSSAQLCEVLKGVPIPISPARMRECLRRWTATANGAAKRRARRPSKDAAANAKPTAATPSTGRSKSGHDDGQPGLKLS